MGYEKIKRPILAPGGLQVTGGSTFTGAVNQTATVTQTGAAIIPVQTLSSASTATVITNYGLTTIWQSHAGTTDQTWKLAAPVVGHDKTILIEPGLRTVTITCTAIAADPFYGSTDTTSLVMTSDASDIGFPVAIQLKGVTSLYTGATGVKWAVLELATGVTIA